MAKETKKLNALARLAPNSLLIPIDGQEIRVAGNKEENAVLNMVMASQMRGLLQENIKKYKEDDVRMTPKELNDLANAAANIAKFSGEVYASGEAISDHEDNAKDKEKNVTGSGGIEDIVFEPVTKVDEVKT